MDSFICKFTYETVRIPDRRRRVGIRGIYGVRNERSKFLTSFLRK